jgi:hypothetical protein
MKARRKRQTTATNSATVDSGRRAYANTHTRIVSTIFSSTSTGYGAKPTPKLKKNIHFEVLQTVANIQHVATMMSQNRSYPSENILVSVATTFSHSTVELSAEFVCSLPSSSPNAFTIAGPAYKELHSIRTITTCYLTKITNRIIISDLQLQN